MRLLVLLTVLSLSLVNAFPDPSNKKCTFRAAPFKDAALPISNLAMKLYQEITASKPNSNIVFSPASIALALALVEAGASGTTQREIDVLLGFSNASVLYESLQHQLRIKNKKANLNIADGLFYANTSKLKDSYVNRAKQCFETRIAEMPFGTDPEGARQEINQWVSDNTAASVSNLVKGGALNSLTVAVLANAVYIKAAWQNQFNEADHRFNSAGESHHTHTVPSMSNVGYYNYASTDEVQVIELPFAEASLSMYIVLPKQKNGLQSMKQNLTGDKLISLFNQTESTYVSLKMPKFSISSSFTLATVLQKLGLKQMFNDSADFSRMADSGMKVSDAIHEANINVDIYGIESPWETGKAIAPSAVAPPTEEPTPFVADHPFIFSIVHKPTLAITLMGEVNSIHFHWEK